MIPTHEGAAVNNGIVVGADGNTIGPVGTVYADEAAADPTWVTVKNGYFGTSESFVPMNDATVNEDTITVPYTKEQVKQAPLADTDEPLTPAAESDVRTYFQGQ